MDTAPARSRPTFRIERRDVDDPLARSLLADYFAERAATRPASAGAYATVFPDRALFVPPAGVFFVAFDSARSPIACGGVRRVPVVSAPPAGAPPASAVALPSGEARVALADFGGTAWYEVKHLYTVPSARGRGVGAELLRDLEAAASRLGADRIVLDTHSSLEGAAKTYARGGYSPVEPYNANGNADRWYGKRLS